MKIEFYKKDTGEKVEFGTGMLWVDENGNVMEMYFDPWETTHPEWRSDLYAVVSMN